jgi:hypothetical protein
MSVRRPPTILLWRLAREPTHDGHHLARIIPRCEDGSMERNYLHKQLADFTYGDLGQGMPAVGSLKANRSALVKRRPDSSSLGCG